MVWQDKVDSDISGIDNNLIDASGTTWDHLPSYAFDDDLSTKWLHFVSENAWISYHLPEGGVVNSYSITSGDDVPGRDPKHWRFEASIDGLNWIILDEQEDQSFTSRYQKR